jgi:hypothetical protein
MIELARVVESSVYGQLAMHLPMLSEFVGADIRDDKTYPGSALHFIFPLVDLIRKGRN